MRNDIKKGLAKFYGLQLLIIGLASMGFYAKASLNGLISSLLGGFVCLVPSLIFALKFFKHQGAQKAKKIINAFYLGEVTKLVVTGILFAIVFLVYQVNALAFFVTFISVQAVYWLAPWLIVKE